MDSTAPLRRLYRIQTDSHRDTILEGIGAQLRGGRWNAKGRPMVYMATTPELCFLEYMVHLEGTPLADLPPLILCEIDVPDNSITFLDIAQLPVGWNDPYVTPPGLPAFAMKQFEQYQTLCHRFSFHCCPSVTFPQCVAGPTPSPAKRVQDCIRTAVSN